MFLVISSHSVFLYFCTANIPMQKKIKDLDSKTYLFLFYKICVEMNLCCLMAFVLSFHWHTPLTVDRNFFNNTKCNNGISISHKCQQILGTNSDLLKRHSRSYAPLLSLTPTAIKGLLISKANRYVIWSPHTLKKQGKKFENFLWFLGYEYEKIRLFSFEIYWPLHGICGFCQLPGSGTFILFTLGIGHSAVNLAGGFRYTAKIYDGILWTREGSIRKDFCLGSGLFGSCNSN